MAPSYPKYCAEESPFQEARPECAGYKPPVGYTPPKENDPKLPAHCYVYSPQQIMREECRGYIPPYHPPIGDFTPRHRGSSPSLGGAMAAHGKPSDPNLYGK